MSKRVSTIILLLIVSSQYVGCLSRAKKPQVDATVARLSELESVKLEDISVEAGGNNSKDLQFHLHKFGTTDTPCEVPLSSVGTTGDDADIHCVLDAEEKDLHNAPLKLRIEVPPNTCHYVTIEPFWFWNRQPGITQVGTYKQVIIDSNCGGADNTLGTGDDICNNNGSNVCPTAQPDEPVCAFDYSDFDGPNCDQGIINYTIETWSLDDTTGTCGGVPTAAEKDCGGDYTACIQGPGKDHAVDEDDWPIPTYTYAFNDGASIELDIAASGDVNGGESKGTGTNHYADNWTAACYDGSSLNSSSTTYNVDGLLSYAINKNDASGSVTGTVGNGAVGNGETYFAAADARADFLGATPQPYYVFSCEDAAKETQARIRLQVRSWDLEFSVSTADTLNTILPTKLDQNGYEPNTFSDVVNNDYRDWDDYSIDLSNRANDTWIYDPSTATTDPLSCDDPNDTAGGLTNRTFPFPGLGID